MTAAALRQVAARLAFEAHLRFLHGRLEVNGVGNSRSLHSGPRPWPRSRPAPSSCRRRPTGGPRTARPAVARQLDHIPRRLIDMFRSSQLEEIHVATPTSSAWSAPRDPGRAPGQRRGALPQGGHLRQGPVLAGCYCGTVMVNVSGLKAKLPFFGNTSPESRKYGVPLTPMPSLLALNDPVGA
jgi:hypothetical protein